MLCVMVSSKLEIFNEIRHAVIDDSNKREGLAEKRLESRESGGIVCLFKYIKMVTFCIAVTIFEALCLQRRISAASSASARLS